MTTQADALEDSTPMWRLMLENIPYDPLSVVIYVAMAGFLYVVWRNITFD